MHEIFNFHRIVTLNDLLMLFNDFGELVNIKLHDHIAHIEFEYYYNAIKAMNTYSTCSFFTSSINIKTTHILY